MERISRAERSGNLTSYDSLGKLADYFSFDVIERTECLQSHKVRYTRVPEENTLTLEIPVDKADNLKELESYKITADSEKELMLEEKSTPPKAVVKFENCIKSWLSSEIFDGFMSSATGQRGKASKCIRMGSLPPYLMVKLKRYVLAEDWTPKKIDARVFVPEYFDFSELMGTGLKPNEEELPEMSSVIEPSAEIVDSLVAMGFSENGCKRAAIAVKNSDVESAMNWIFAHMEDPDFNEPLNAASISSSPGVNPESLMMLVSMGFEESQSEKALKATNGDVERATDWLFSRANDMDVDEKKSHESTSATESFTNCKYELVAIISHIGTSTLNGHYVCHIKKDGIWAIFNDNKVAKSEAPPFDLGYLYLFKQVRNGQ